MLDFLGSPHNRRYIAHGTEPAFVLRFTGHKPGFNRAFQAFDRLFTKTFQLKQPADLALRFRRDHNLVRRCHRLQTRRQVRRIANHIVLLLVDGVEQVAHDD